MPSYRMPKNTITTNKYPMTMRATAACLRNNAPKKKVNDDMKIRAGRFISTR